MPKLAPWVACLSLLAAAGTSWPGETRTSPGKGADARGEVLLPSGRLLQVEIADTPERRARGYMFRERISDREGMLFLMGELDFHPIWMKNCKVGLDILWLDEGWRVVHIERKVPPCLKDPCPSYVPIQASMYVLELKEGLSEREGMKLGDWIIYRPAR